MASIWPENMIFEFRNLASYEGPWRKGKCHGPGKLSYKSGEVVEGVWDKGEMLVKDDEEIDHEVELKLLNID